MTADETRPLLQGARLTAFELVQMGVEHRIVVDGAGPSIIARGLTDAVVVGADRIAANGDVANKIGTYPLALAAARAGIPFVVAAPESTLDPATPTGDDIEIEERSPDEILGVGDRRVGTGRVGRPEPGVRRHAGRPRDGDRHRGAGDPPGAGGAAVSAASPAPPVGRLLDLSGRVAVVTGVSGGIGHGIARRLGEAGASVVLHCRRDRAAAEVLATSWAATARSS